jgi:hypothetical protein
MASKTSTTTTTAAAYAGNQPAAVTLLLQKTTRALGRIFSNLSAIISDGNLFMQLMRVTRCALAVLRAQRGEHPAVAAFDRDLESALADFEGLQIFTALSSLLARSKEDAASTGGDHSSLEARLERLTFVAFALSDIATGILWLAGMGIPILGAYSTSAAILHALDLAACGTALVGMLSDGAIVAKKLSSGTLAHDCAKTDALWHLAGRTAGAAALVLIMISGVGQLAGSMALGLGGASAAIDIVRFLNS